MAVYLYTVSSVVVLLVLFRSCHVAL